MVRAWVGRADLIDKLRGGLELLHGPHAQGFDGLQDGVGIDRLAAQLLGQRASPEEVDLAVQIGVLLVLALPRDADVAQEPRA
eukprot:8386015-Lingulodinium_polyedra.AAC.1